MKHFDSSFFTEQNFLKSKEIYNHLSVENTAELRHVCFNINDSFFPYMGATIVSILKNNPNDTFVFHVFTDGYSDENKKKIIQLAQEQNCCIILYVLHMEPFAGFHIKVARWSRITYARFYMPKLLQKDTNRFLYVDADTVCVGSLEKLWNLDLKGHAIGVVMDTPQSIAQRVPYLKLKHTSYFNDGVMLVDIPAWEKQHLTEKTFSYQDEPRKRFLGQDQDILNIVLDGDVYYIPPEYNAYGSGEKYYHRDDAIIVHWTGRRKPWQMVLTKFDKKWRDYNAISPWDTITNIYPIKKPENYHDFQQWGRFQKQKGNFLGYLYGIFWYIVLRTKYKL